MVAIVANVSKRSHLEEETREIVIVIIECVAIV